MHHRASSRQAPKWSHARFAITTMRVAGRHRESFSSPPIHIKPGVPYASFAQSAVERSHELSRWYRKAAERNGWLFLDAATVAEPSDLDKLHMNPEGHARLADAIAGILLADAAR